MNRQQFTDTKKRLYKGYWIQERPDAILCPECHDQVTANRRANGQVIIIDTIAAMETCRNCNGKGFVTKPAFRYHVPSKKKFEKADTVTTVWASGCPRCDKTTRQFKRTGKCDCFAEKCPQCHGRRCRHCNFKGVL